MKLLAPGEDPPGGPGAPATICYYASVMHPHPVEPAAWAPSVDMGPYDAEHLLGGSWDEPTLGSTVDERGIPGYVAVDGEGESDVAEEPPYPWAYGRVLHDDPSEMLV